MRESMMSEREDAKQRVLSSASQGSNYSGGTVPVPWARLWLRAHYGKGPIVVATSVGAFRFALEDGRAFQVPVDGPGVEGGRCEVEGSPVEVPASVLRAEVASWIPGQMRKEWWGRGKGAVVVERVEPTYFVYLEGGRHFHQQVSWRELDDRAERRCEGKPTEVLSAEDPEPLEEGN